VPATRVSVITRLPPRSGRTRNAIAAFCVSGLCEREEALASTHRRRLVSAQAPEATDGSRDDLCAGALAQGNDARGELFERQRR
jgi:hypothetical protein